MTKEQFIEQIAKYVQKYSVQYGIMCNSAVISQAILESGFGTSELATKANNYFGLKYNPKQPKRCPTACGYYTKIGSEQNKDGTYTSSTMLWQKFKNMEDGVKGYFDFINNSNYSNLKGITDSRKYLETIKADKYCTSLSYVYNCMNVVKTYNLTKYDNKGSDNRMTKIAIDAGHGSQTGGKRTPDGYREHWINVKVAYYCEQYLKSKGIQTVRIGWNDTNSKDDTDYTLSYRQKLIKNAKCDYPVSCHANAFGNGTTYNSANGVETLISNVTSYQKDSLRFAQCVQNRLIQGTKQTNRGVKKQSLAMCNCVAMGTKASCLVEIAFMTNKFEADLMKTESFCKEQGEDIAKGICDYLGINTSQAPTSTPTTNPSTTTPIPTTTTSINQFTPLKGNPTHFAEIIKNIKLALNTDYGLKFTIDSSINDILLINLSNVVLSTTTYKNNITYALQQLLVWWGYSLTIDGIYGNGTKSIISLFQSQVDIAQTGTTTKEFWYKILGK